MSFPPKIRHLLVSAAVFVACVIQYVRGYRPLILVVGAIAFLLAGNLAVYLSGEKQRAIRRQQKRDYWASR